MWWWRVFLGRLVADEWKVELQILRLRVPVVCLFVMEGSTDRALITGRAVHALPHTIPVTSGFRPMAAPQKRIAMTTYCTQCLIESVSCLLVQALRIQANRSISGQISFGI